MYKQQCRAQDYAEGGLNFKIDFRKLKYYCFEYELYPNTGVVSIDKAAEVRVTVN